MFKVIVTGGSGFLGYHTVTALLRKSPDAEIFIFDEKEPDWPFQGEVVAQDVADPAGMQRKIRQLRPNAIVHLAGILGTGEQVYDVLPSLRVNTVATVELLEFLKNEFPGVRVALTVNGNGEWNNTYAITKEAAGRFALMFNKEFDTEFAVIRPFNAFGEWQKAHPIRKIGPHVITRALENAPIEIFGTGEQQFDLIYAGDVGEVLAQAVLHPVSDFSQIFECGRGSTVTPVSFSKMVIDMIDGSHSDLHFLPMRSGEPETSVLVADVSTMKPLGLPPKGEDCFESALRRTIDWYRTAVDGAREIYIDRA